MPDARVVCQRQEKTKDGDNMLADVVTPEVQTERKVNYRIAPLLVDRWSPRSSPRLEVLASKGSAPATEAQVKKSANVREFLVGRLVGKHEKHLTLRTQGLLNSALLQAARSRAQMALLAGPCLAEHLSPGLDRKLARFEIGS